MTDNAPTPQEIYATFRERRHQAVTMPQGNLALTTTAWFYGAPGIEEQVWGVRGWWSTRAEGESGITLRADASEGIIVDGAVVDAAGRPLRLLDPGQLIRRALALVTAEAERAG